MSFLTNQLFFRTREEAIAVNSALSQGIVVHLTYLVTSQTHNLTHEEVFDTDKLPLFPDAVLPRWILDKKCGGRGIINNRTVCFNLAKQQEQTDERGGWTIIHSGASFG